MASDSNVKSVSSLGAFVWTRNGKLYIALDDSVVARRRENQDATTNIYRLRKVELIT